MGGEEWIIIALAVAGALVYGAVQFVRMTAAATAREIRGVVHARERRKQDARTWVERRALQLLAEFPDMEDASIAMLLRDELLNARATDQELYTWATADTVGRMRRTILVHLARQERAELPAERRAVVVLARECPGCQQRIRGDAVRCPNCAHSLR